jgi:hypothetical protein
MQSLRLHIVCHAILWWLGPLSAKDQSLAHHDECIVALSPVDTKDATLSDQINTALMPKVRTLLQPYCGHIAIVDQSRSNSGFDYVGQTPFFNGPLTSIPNRGIDYVAAFTRATHLVELKYAASGKSTLKIYHYDDQQEFLELAIVDHVDATVLSPYLKPNSKVLNFLALLTPNTTTTGFVTTTVAVSPEEPYSLQTTTLKTHLPQIISSIGFNKIDHYRAFAVVDIKYSLFPSTFLFAIDQTSYFVNNNNQFDTFAVPISVYGGCITANAMASLHIPLGTLYGAAGIGPCTYRSQIGSAIPSLRGNMALRYLLGHRTFMTESTYLFWEFDIVQFLGAPIYRSEHVSASALSRFTLGAGLYVTEAERIFTDLWR